MKVHGETIFDICYLAIAVIVGCYILMKKLDKLGMLMGGAILVLGSGDAFHLIPRILNYFINYDFTAFLGIGKLITSITMTIFYIFMFYIYEENYKDNKKQIEYGIWGLAIVRLLLCLLPQNGWVTNNGTIMMGIVRNVPFVLIGIIIIILYFNKRDKDKIFRYIWIYVVLSFAFYIPVVVGATIIPILGMFMLPKTICYILIILSFRKKVNKKSIT